jgi:hypothetical protein
MMGGGGSEVLHGKFPLEGRYGMLKKCCTGCGHKATSILYMCHIGRQIRRCQTWHKQSTRRRCTWQTDCTKPEVPVLAHTRTC